MRKQIEALTGLRLVAAMSIVTSHAIATMTPGTDDALLRMFGNTSGFGMSLFFVLSGFVIHANYEQSVQTRSGLWRYFAARFARLYPLYFLFLCLDLITSLEGHQLHLQRLSALPYYLTLTQSWIYHPIDGNALVYQFGLVPQVSWSISTECFFYVCFPVLCVLLTTFDTAKKALAAIAGLCLFSFAVVIAVDLHAAEIFELGKERFGDVGSSLQDGLFRWLTYFSPYVRILEFILGCLISSLVQSLKCPTEAEQRLGLALLVGTIVGAILLQWEMFGRADARWIITVFHTNFGFAPVSAIMIFCCARHQNSIVRILSNAKIVMAGEASYSMYLIHVVMVTGLARATVSYGDILHQLAIITLATIGASLVLYHIVEVPARDTLRRVLGNRKLRRVLGSRKASVTAAASAGAENPSLDNFAPEARPLHINCLRSTTVRLLPPGEEP
jgi:peptidoglycan/LPS O-acetylase OafA/YrhL